MLGLDLADTGVMVCVKVKLRREGYSANAWNLWFSSKANYMCLIEEGVLSIQVKLLQIPLDFVAVATLKSCHSQNCLS